MIATKPPLSNEPAGAPASLVAEPGAVRRGGPFCVNERPPIEPARAPQSDGEFDNPACRFIFGFAAAAFVVFIGGLGDSLSDAVCFALLLGTIAGGIAICGKGALDWVLAFLSYC